MTNVYQKRNKIAVARVTIWETAVPPNFICLCVCDLSLASLVSQHQLSRYALACIAAHQVNILT